ncbi:hypothetical protein B9Z55_025153 [Caenorhabditis nigoni]|uniref:Uncharacterized protein n=1 Tax=Caenorhabditis nigoni TaxID=1611254 RepID=A0A2G5SXW9_9PELO|nr:hypothetical protein B9Z55_025153 [Caenorhabditis nigoni]
MRISFVLFILIAAIIVPVVPTGWIILGRITCQKAVPWCYSIQLAEIDSSSNDIMDSFAACEFKSSHQDYHLKGMEAWDGIFDGNFETELLIEHDCGLEATEEKQTIRMTFDPISTTTQYVRKEININLGKNETEIIKAFNTYLWE